MSNRPSGLKTNGRACPLNAILQSLYAHNVFRSRVWETAAKLDRSSLHSQLAEIFTAMRSTRTVIDTLPFRDAVGLDFDSADTNIGVCVEDLYRLLTAETGVESMFECESVYNIFCQNDECGHHWQTRDAFRVFDVPLQTMTVCNLDIHIHELLTWPVAIDMACDECGHTENIRTREIRSSSEILVFRLTRLAAESAKTALCCLSACIEFGDCVYRPCALVLCDSSHGDNCRYSAIVRMTGEKWWHCRDTDVRSVSDTEVEKYSANACAVFCELTAKKSVSKELEPKIADQIKTGEQHDSQSIGL